MWRLASTTAKVNKWDQRSLSMYSKYNCFQLGLFDENKDGKLQLSEMARSDTKPPLEHVMYKSWSSIGCNCFQTASGARELPVSTHVRGEWLDLITKPATFTKSNSLPQEGTSITALDIDRVFHLYDRASAIEHEPHSCTVRNQNDTICRMGMEE